MALATSPGIRELFELRPTLPAVTDAFFLADLIVGVAGSALGSWALWSDARWAVPVIAATTGGLLYATLFLVLWVAMEGTGPTTPASPRHEIARQRCSTGRRPR